MNRYILLQESPYGSSTYIFESFNDIGELRIYMPKVLQQLNIEVNSHMENINIIEYPEAAGKIPQVSV